MKTITTATMLAFAGCVFGQAQSEPLNNTPEQGAATMTSLNAPESNSPEVSSQKFEIQQQIAQIEYHLQAIESKKEFILSDPNEKAIAEEQGWFENMEKTSKELIEKKNQLQLLIEEPE